ncbi:unnamed protein product [Blepharisma stoltei]|uniref:C2H2-type domain-containing protein n=1 Tax=Blepharisma stoltei TaxID=1481888 RepID=A0AAU9IWJ6_9CILI|nr:unnamed protein product [Blepharisma stoltei]
MFRSFPTAPFQIAQQQPKIEISAPNESRNDMKNKRRSKSDQEGRTYKCGCGKMYLSYPALYTHIKTKHDGITPEGTNAPQFKNGRGRGRPRKIKDTTEPVRVQITHPSDNIRKNPNFADEISYLREIGHYSQEGTDPTENFPRVFKNNQETEHPILATLKEESILHEKAKNGEFVQEKENKGDRIMAKFLWEHAKICQKEFYKAIVLFIVLLYKFLDEEIEENFLLKYNCEEVPCYLAQFMKYLEVIKCEFNEEDLEKLVKHYAEWLYSHGYTHIRILDN